MITVYKHGERQRKARDAFARAFEAARIKSGMSMRQLGAAVGTSHQAIMVFRHPEKGLPSPGLTRKAAAAVGMDAERARRLWVDAKAEEGRERAVRRAEAAW